MKSLQNTGVKLYSFLTKYLVFIFLIISQLFLVKCEDETKTSLPKLPICEIKTPINNDVLGIGENIVIEVNAWGESSRRKIDLYLYFDDHELVYFTERPFTYSFKPFSINPGKHTIRSIAYDDIGNINEDFIEFTVIETIEETESFIDFDHGIPISFYTNDWKYSVSTGLDNTGSIKAKSGNSILITRKKYDQKGHISFYVNNINGDLVFYDNGKIKAKWFEQEQWSKYSYYVNPGDHTFRWKCTSPEIFIDNINFVEGKVDHTLGEYFGGGVIYYLEENKKHGLIVSEFDLGTTNWGCFSNNVNSGNQASSQTDGMANTFAIVTDCPELTCAARLCYDYEVIEGDSIYDDWYLPAPEQLIILQANKNILGNFKDKDYNTPYEDVYWSSYIWYWAPEIYGYEAAGSVSFRDGRSHGAMTSLVLNVRAIKSF